MISLTNHDYSEGEQWGRYNLPRYVEDEESCASYFDVQEVLTYPHSFNSQSLSMHWNQNDHRTQKKRFFLLVHITSLKKPLKKTRRNGSAHIFSSPNDHSPPCRAFPCKYLHSEERMSPSPADRSDEMSQVNDQPWGLPGFNGNL